jgi:uncharacterized coiled-coil protein SlyX
MDNKPLDVPDAALIDADPLLFRERFAAFVAAAARQQDEAGDLARVAADLRAALAGEQARAEAAEAQAARQEEAIAALHEQHALAVAAYRQALLDGDASIPPVMVEGETVEEVNAAVARARAVVEYVRGQVERGADGERVAPGSAAPRVPAGAFGRAPLDTTGMSAAEKLAYGAELARNGRA